jgi:hypothetical protein
VKGYYSHYNLANQAPGRRLLEYCFDKKCPIQFKSRETVLPEMVELINGLDARRWTPTSVRRSL